MDTYEKQQLRGRKTSSILQYLNEFLSHDSLYPSVTEINPLSHEKGKETAPDEAFNIDPGNIPSTGLYV